MIADANILTFLYFLFSIFFLFVHLSESRTINFDFYNTFLTSCKHTKYPNFWISYKTETAWMGSKRFLWAIIQYITLYKFSFAVLFRKQNLL